ncbi:MAG: DMT family transporter [Vicinamibacterales bacterium]
MSSEPTQGTSPLTAGRRGVLWMTVAVAGWAMVEIIGGLLERPYSLFQVVWSRYAVHLLFMLVVVGRGAPGALWRTRRLRYQVGRSMLMLGMPACFIFGLAGGAPAGAFLSVFWTSPLLILVLARVLLRERARVLLVAAAVAAFAGMVLLQNPVASLSPSAVALALGMSFCFALYVVMTRSLRTEWTGTNLFYTALGPFLPLTAVMPFMWTTPDLHDALVLAAIGVVGLGSLYALDRSAALAPVSLTSPAQYLQGVWTFAIVFALGAMPHLGRRIPVASAVIVAATCLTWWFDSRLLGTPDDSAS